MAADDWALPETPREPAAPPVPPNDPAADKWALPLANTPAAVRNSLTHSLDSNPDQEAALRRAAQSLQVPLQTARAQPDVVKTQAAVQSVDAQGLAQRFPKTAQWLTTPDNARLAHDDIPQMATVESAVGPQPPPAPPPPAPDGLPSLSPRNATYRERIEDAVRGWLGMDPAGRDEGAAARATIAQAAKEAGQTSSEYRASVVGPVSYLTDIVKQFGQHFATEASLGAYQPEVGAPDTFGQTAASGLGSLAGFLGGLPLRIGAGVVAHAAPAILERAAGDSFVKALAKDVTTQAATLGIASGAASAGQALDQSTPEGAVSTVLRAAGTGAATGAAFGVAGRLFPGQGVTQFLGRAAAMNVGADLATGSTPWDDRSPEQKVFDYALNTFFATHGSGKPGGGFLYDAARADEAKRSAEILGGIAQASAGSKLRERAPDLFKQFAADAADGGPVPNVYVDATTFAEALHQAGVGLDELTAKMPEAAQQLPEALSSGGQVKIPIEDFATHIAGGKLEAALVPHLRTDPEGMTQTESEAFYQSHADDLKAEAGRIEAQQTADQPAIDSRQQVHDQVLDQLKATGRFPDDVAGQYAALTRDFYSTMADRAGVAPHELFAQHPLAIQAENVAGLAQPARGGYDPATGTIALLKGADLSTFLHESGHHFLDTLGKIAGAEGAPAELKADMAQALKFMGHSGDLADWDRLTLDQQREGHETFARGFERYLMEGKAPSFELRSLFQRFRGWLLNVYQSLKALHVELTPEVRGVFDRMLASRESIEAAEQARAYMPLFDTPEAGGMTPEQWTAYQATGNAATQRAVDDLGAKTVKDLAWSDRARSKALKDLAKDADEKRKEIRIEARAEVMATPVYRVWQYLTARPDKVEASPAVVKYRSDLAEWTAKREDYAESAQRDAGARAWEASPASADVPTAKRGIAKGQFIAKNRGEISLDAQREVLKWERENPQPERPDEAAPAVDAEQSGKLLTSMLKGMVPKAEFERLRDLRMTSEERGIDPQIVSELHGFDSPEAMLRELTTAEKPKDVIDRLTEQRMVERHAEVATPEALATAADVAVHNDLRARFLATELNALKKATGSAADLAKAAKDVAEASIAGKRVRDISERSYLAAEAKAGRLAMERLKAGDTAGAAVAKRDQLLNNALARAARDAQADVDKGLRYLDRFNKPAAREAIDVDYRDQIDGLLDRYDLRKSVSGKALDKREGLREFVERKAAEGYEPGVPQRLLDEARRVHFKEMPVDEFRGLVDSVRSIDHLGRLKDKLLDGKEEREITALAKEVAESAAKLPQSLGETNRGLTRIGEKWLGVKSAGRSLSSSLMKIEQYLDHMDARNPNGALNRVVFRRIADAGVHQHELQADMKRRFDELAALHLEDVTKDAGQIFVADKLIDGLTGQPQRFRKKELLMLAGHMGNDSNADKLARGEGWDQADVWQFLHANMSKADWDFVAGYGRALESLWPEKVAMSRRLGNSNPEKVQPRPFDTPHGRYPGWYWPITYDPARAQDVHERGARRGDALFENIYSTPGTDTGRLTTRMSGYAKPMLLDFDVLPRVISDEIHDIAYREAVIDADRFLSDKRVRDAIVKASSQQHYDQLRPWLQSIANDGRTSTDSMRALKWFNDLAHGVRTRATMVGLGFRLSTAAVHGLSAGLESLSEVGPKYMAMGMNDFRNPLQWAANRDFIYERSGEMRHRSNEIDRDMRDNLREIDLHALDPVTGAAQRGKDYLRARAYSLISTLDMMSALPTWMGAYHKAMDAPERGGLGMSEQDAIYSADKAVRNAHGGGGTKDLAAVQRGPEFFKLFSMFYTFWNHNVNRIVDTGKLIVSSEHRAAAREANNWSNSELATVIIMRTLAYTIGVQAIHTLFHPPKDGDAEGWAAWAAKEFASSAFDGVPILRSVAQHYLTGRDYSATPDGSIVKAIGTQGQDAMNALTGKPASDKWLAHAATTAGYAFNLPTGQVGNTAQFLWDLADGKSNPNTVADWYRGLTTGSIKEH